MEKIKGGYILQPRCFDSSEAAHFPPCTREVWFFILRNVNHADSGKFKRGSAFFNFTDIQNALAWTVGYRIEKYSKPQLTKAIRRLCEGNMIETAKATRGVFITVLNYNKYQDPSLYEGNGEGNAKETRKQPEGVHLKQEERIKKKESSSLSQERFDLFWEKYPRKSGKKDAFRAWEKNKCFNGHFELIMEKVDLFSALCVGKDSQFIPLPATWINGERWNDEMELQQKGEKIGGYHFE